MKKISCLILSFLAVCFSVNSQVAVTPFVKGDRVVFAGNSITEHGYYESYIWLYYMLHFPQMRIDVFNAGVGGDVAKQIYARLDGDILAKKPTVLSVSFGMNDSRYFEYNKGVAEEVRKSAVEESYKGFLQIQEKIKGLQGVKKILMTTSPYDETMKNPQNYFPGKSATIEKIAQFQLEAARTNNWGFVDLLHPMTEINLKGQKIKPEFTITGPDRIHPGNGGHLVMAYLFLKAQGLTGKPVADVKIDASKKKVLQSVNCSVSKVTASGKSISFDYLAKSLPFPIDTVARVFMNPQKQGEALDVIPFTNDLNREILAVAGLRGQKYQVSIDGKVIGSWSAADLAKGINLAVIKTTPQYMQASEIMDLNQKRHDMEWQIRNYYWVQYDFLKDKGLLFNDSDAVRDTINKYAPTNGWLNVKKGDYEIVRVKSTKDEFYKKMDGLTNEIYQKNTPKVHKIKVEQI
ncbi:MAG: SGNH/GDSL hydrolase family protein [Bacteroidota bacterium]|nr:SGNH/GDSL hydrolase family protein [Bacteroidota bacterium]